MNGKSDRACLRFELLKEALLGGFEAARTQHRQAGCARAEVYSAATLGLRNCLLDEVLQAFIVYILSSPLRSLLSLQVLTKFHFVPGLGTLPAVA